MNRYNKPVGWRYESHKHSLAARGVKTKYNARKISAFGSFVTGAGQIVAGSQDPTTDFAKRYRKETEQQRTGIVSAPGVSQQARVARIQAASVGLTPAEAELKKRLDIGSRKGLSSGEEARQTFLKNYLTERQRIANQITELNNEKANATPSQQLIIDSQINNLRGLIIDMDRGTKRSIDADLARESKLRRKLEKSESSEVDAMEEEGVTRITGIEGGE